MKDDFGLARCQPNLFVGSYRSGVYRNMTRRLGFRHVLPVLLLLVQLTIFLWDWAYEGHPLVAPESPMNWTVGKRISTAMRLSAVFNLPALEMALPFHMAIPNITPTGTILASIPFVPLIWYGIGLWLDRLLGRAALPQKQHPSLRRAGRTFAAIVICLTVTSMTPLNHHRGHDSYWVGGTAIVWAALLYAMCTVRGANRQSTLRRPRNERR